MRLLAQLYYLLTKRLSYHRFNSPEKFNRLYTLDEDPFNVRDSRYEKHKFDLMMQVLGDQRFEYLLDIGCGTGGTTKRIANIAKHIVAIDFSERAIELAREYCQDEPNIEFCVADVTQFTYADPFDCFVCSEVLYYLPNDGLIRAIENMNLLATPGAVLVAVTRMDDETVFPELSRRFERLRSAKSKGWLRPFRIDLFQIK
jgi:2-polyprenyl-3-methyl-5-hydroxy-6-metoxy-1,4-benzoquinol methylase